MGALTIKNMFRLYEDELQNKGHNPVIMPSVIPESNLKKESNHIKGSTPEVFWLKSGKDEEKLCGMLDDLHKELKTVLQICLRVQKFETGIFESDELLQFDWLEVKS